MSQRPRLTSYTIKLTSNKKEVLTVSNKQRSNENQPVLKGTLISVFAIGFIILISWFSAYIFHFTR